MIGSGDGPTLKDRRDAILAVVVSANKVSTQYEILGLGTPDLYGCAVRVALEELREAVSKMNSCLITSAVADFMQEKNQ